MVAYLADTVAVMAAGRASVAFPFEASAAFREPIDSPSVVRQACPVLEVGPCRALVAFPMEIEDSFDRCQASALVACRELAVVVVAAVVGAVVACHCCWAAFC